MTRARQVILGVAVTCALLFFAGCATQKSSGRASHEFAFAFSWENGLRSMKQLGAANPPAQILTEAQKEGERTVSAARLPKAEGIVLVSFIGDQQPYLTRAAVTDLRPNPNDLMLVAGERDVAAVQALLSDGHSVNEREFTSKR